MEKNRASFVESNRSFNHLWQYSLQYSACTRLCHQLASLHSSAKHKSVIVFLQNTQNIPYLLFSVRFNTTAPVFAFVLSAFDFATAFATIIRGALASGRFHLCRSSPLARALSGCKFRFVEIVIVSARITTDDFLCLRERCRAVNFVLWK